MTKRKTEKRKGGTVMIKNVIFDIGNVLGHFCWEEVLKTKMGLSEDAFDAVAAATVKSK